MPAFLKSPHAPSRWHSSGSRTRQGLTLTNMGWGLPNDCVLWNILHPQLVPHLEIDLLSGRTLSRRFCVDRSRCHATDDEIEVGAVLSLRSRDVGHVRRVPDDSALESVFNQVRSLYAVCIKPCPVREKMVTYSTPVNLAAQGHTSHLATQGPTL